MKSLTNPGAKDIDMFSMFYCINLIYQNFFFIDLYNFLPYLYPVIILLSISEKVKFKVVVF